jgi:hypothetical protein
LNRPRRRRCPRCQALTSRLDCCGIDLTVRRRRFRMTNDLLRMVHATVARKGLDEETYRLRLQAVGVSSSKAFDRATFQRFMSELAKLPDASTARRARG